MQKKPIYQFSTDAELGINNLTVGSLITCLNVAGSVKHFQVLNKNLVTSATTISQAIGQGNLIETSPHTHQVSEVAGLQTVLDNKAALKSTSTTFGGLKTSVTGNTLVIESV